MNDMNALFKALSRVEAIEKPSIKLQELSNAQAVGQNLELMIGRSWESATGVRTIIRIMNHRTGIYYVLDNNQLYKPDDLEEMVDLDERQAASRAKHRAKDALRARAIKDEDDAHHALYDGYLDTFDSMRRGRAQKILEKSVRRNGKFTTRLKFMAAAIKRGARVSNIGPKRSKVLEEPGGSFWELTKTELDFAEYLTRTEKDSPRVAFQEHPVYPLLIRSGASASERAMVHAENALNVPKVLTDPIPNAGQGLRADKWRFKVLDHIKDAMDALDECPWDTITSEIVRMKIEKAQRRASW